MTERKLYKMTEAQHKELLEAAQPVPYIAAQCGEIENPQARANRAWAKLGQELGFKTFTARPAGSDPLTFSAVPLEESADGA